MADIPSTTTMDDAELRSAALLGSALLLIDAASLDIERVL